MSNSTLRTLTEVLLNASVRLDIPKIQQITAPNHHRIETDDNGRPMIMHERAEWLRHLQRIFAKLTSVKEKLSYEILEWNEDQGDTVGAVEMKYRLTSPIGGQLVQQLYWVTMIWHQTEQGWQNSHWHASRIEVKPVR